MFSLFLTINLLGIYEIKDTNSVVFRVKVQNAQRVFISGTFNNWNPSTHPMKRLNGDSWEVTLKLQPGYHEYKFVIDGVKWIHDPDNPFKVPDPYGGFNSVLILKDYENLEISGDTVIFRLREPKAKKVYLSGTFVNWAPTRIEMTRKEKDIWETRVKLTPGTYQYKFVIDGVHWREDPLNLWKVDDGYGGFNSVFKITENYELILYKEDISEKDLNPERFPSLGTPVYLAIMWHQHQPMYFKDPQTGEFLYPWVRLHSTKDYYDMAAMLLEFPQINLTFNLTPVLLSQILEIIDRVEKGKSPDKFYSLTLKNADSLTHEEKKFLLENFFSANYDNMIDKFERYRELRLKRVFNPTGSLDVEESIKKFTNQDFRDLQAWFNLVWFDPIFYESEKVQLITGEIVSVKKFVNKHRGFTEKDKEDILKEQIKIIKAVIPIHKHLLEKGQIEITTTPFYHPILPLICNSNSAKMAMPYSNLPDPPFSYPEDAFWHVTEAKKFYLRIFDRTPKGIWPSEGAVSSEIVDIVRKNEIIWMASDVGVLARSLNKGGLTLREKYMPYWVLGDKDSIIMIFRDTDISDKIGFRYKSLSPEEAVFDFISHLYEIHKNLKDEKYPPFVCVILDGENAWEWYPRDGIDFLKKLYETISIMPWIKTTKVSDFVSHFPPTKKIQKLWAGSWIFADFSTWIGEREENIAWEYLREVRRDFDSLKVFVRDPKKIDEAWRELMAAEGSDWFWWLGGDQGTPGGDHPWDEMFRKTLKNVYQTLGVKPKEFLNNPIIAQKQPIHTTREPIAKEYSLLLSIKDPEGDDYGDGTVLYPLDPVFRRGCFDLTLFEIYYGEKDYLFRFQFKNLDDPWNSPYGFSFPLIVIFCGKKPLTGVERNEPPSKAYGPIKFNRDFPWIEHIKISGWQVNKFDIQVFSESTSVYAKIPKKYFNFNEEGWIYLLVYSQDGHQEEEIRPLTSHPTQWTLGTTSKEGPKSVPPIVDYLDPNWTNLRQTEILKKRQAIIPSLHWKPK